MFGVAYMPSAQAWAMPNIALGRRKFRSMYKKTQARVIHLRGTLASLVATADILRGALTWLAHLRRATAGKPAVAASEASV
jgi:hypothetical protein